MDNYDPDKFYPPVPYFNVIRGRPTLYTPELATEICDHIALGVPLRKIALMPDMPTITTIINWLKKHNDFFAQYAKARQIQATLYADELVDKANNATDAALGRLQFDATKWVVSKILWRLYGDKLEITNNEADGNTPAKKLSAQQLRAEIERLKLERGTRDRAIAGRTDTD